MGALSILGVVVKQIITMIILIIPFYAIAAKAAFQKIFLSNNDQDEWAFYI